MADKHADVIVLGSHAAALDWAGRGHDVLLIDEAGGAVPGVRVLCGAVWSVVPGFRVDVVGAGAVFAPVLVAPAVVADGEVVSDVARLLRAPHFFDEALGGWVPVVDAAGMTGVPGLYAPVVSCLPGAPEFQRERGPRVEPGDDVRGGEGTDAVVCRCEAVTRAAIEHAIAAGAREMNQLKAFTRCGMGICQGRECEAAAARLLAPHVGGRAAAGYWTRRPPLVPLPLDTLIGSFDYADIPVPPPAPL